MDKWKRLDREYVVDNRWVKLARDEVLLPNGVTIDDFYVFARKDVSLIVAVDSDRKVLIKKEYRYPVDEFLYEIPGGVIEEGDSPLETAKRELLEETGYVSDDWVHLMSGYDYPAKDTNTVHIFLAKDIRRQGDQRLEETEDIDFEFLPINDTIRMCVENKIRVNGSIAGLMLAEKVLDQQQQ
jgi:8-oxo-dGTP pyrophosphatase MutT (NUDIX family)